MSNSAPVPTPRRWQTTVTWPVALKARVKEAGGMERVIEASRAMRHRYATAVYDATGDIVAVQQLLGHASLSTTRVYVAISRRRLADAAAGAVASRLRRAA